MARLYLFLAVLVTLGGCPSWARAETVRVIDKSRIALGDVALSLPPELSGFDLGAAPQPGASRLVSRDEVERALRRIGLSTEGVRMEPVVRVQGAAKTLLRGELVGWLSDPIAEQLPEGVSLRSVSPSAGVTTSPSASIGRVTIPRLPKRAGAVHTTALVELHRDAEIVGRMSVSLVVEVSERAAEPTVPRGARVTLVITTGAARVSTQAVALEPADVGEVVGFRVSRTGKTLRARLESADSATVVTP